MEQKPAFTRELCNQKHDHSLCRNSEPYCNKLHNCELEELRRLLEFCTVCMYGENCDNKQCSQLHLSQKEQEREQFFTRELCDKNHDHSLCRTSEPYCNKLHECKLKDLEYLCNNCTLCMYGKYCDAKQCSHLHLLQI